MTLRPLLGAVLALAAFAPAASAQQFIPLAGKGENIDPVVRVPIDGANEVELAGDWAFVSQDAVGGNPGGMTIVNIANPERPFVQGRWDASMAGLTDGSYGDVDLSPDGNLAVLTNAHCDTCAEGQVAWVVLIDVTDKSKPKLVGKIVDDGTLDYVHTTTLDGNLLYTNPQAAAFYPQQGNGHITVFDISDRAAPVKKATITVPGGDVGLSHDSYIDHRPDGKTLLYGASVHKTDVIDVTDPFASRWLQSSTSPQYTLSHDAQPNHDRTIIVVDDEGLAGGQLEEGVSACGRIGTGPATVDSGSVHFFAAAPDGTLANGGAVNLGSFNAPTNVNTGACVAHVFWQAPDENRLTQAYYRTGAFVLDFEDPAAPKSLGSFVATGGAKYWSNKPHNGYLYATDMESGLDILKYVGEGGTRWPATAGPAEVQRSARQGVPYVPIVGTAANPAPTAPPAGGGQPTAPPATTTPPPPAPAPTPVSGAQSGAGSQPAADGGAAQSGGAAQTGGSTKAAPARKLGAFAFTAAVKRVPGKAGKRAPLVLTFLDAGGKPAGRFTVRRAAGRKATLKVSGVAVTGRYRWALTSGGKLLRKGTATSKAKSGLALSRGAVLAATVR